ncbi:hypothetical protein SNEBB_011366 [Seison nebaliae]|nr:hypothetical protein SNEBB_011366 [Seison nebaliae]
MPIVKSNNNNNHSNIISNQSINGTFSHIIHLLSNEFVEELFENKTNDVQHLVTNEYLPIASNSILKFQHAPKRSSSAGNKIILRANNNSGIQPPKFEFRHRQDLFGATLFTTSTTCTTTAPTIVSMEKEYGKVIDCIPCPPTTTISVDKHQMNTISTSSHSFSRYYPTASISSSFNQPLTQNIINNNNNNNNNSNTKTNNMDNVKDHGNMNSNMDHLIHPENKLTTIESISTTSTCVATTTTSVITNPISTIPINSSNNNNNLINTKFMLHQTNKIRNLLVGKELVVRSRMEKNFAVIGTNNVRVSRIKENSADKRHQSRTQFMYNTVGTPVDDFHQPNLWNCLCNYKKRFVVYRHQHQQRERRLKLLRRQQRQQLEDDCSLIKKEKYTQQLSNRFRSFINDPFSIFSVNSKNRCRLQYDARRRNNNESINYPTCNDTDTSKLLLAKKQQKQRQLESDEKTGNEKKPLELSDVSDCSITPSDNLTSTITNNGTIQSLNCSEFFDEKNRLSQQTQQFKSDTSSVTSLTKQQQQLLQIKNPNSTINDSHSTSQQSSRFITSCHHVSLAIQPTECHICYSQRDDVARRDCCELPVCENCLTIYVEDEIKSGKVRIECPMCNVYMSREQIMQRLLTTELKLKFYRRLIDFTTNNPRARTCPQCSFVLHLNRDLINKKRRQKIPMKVQCPECSIIWCFNCHAPWHQNITCEDFSRGDQLLKCWAKEHHYGRRNAQMCPKCQVYIQREEGCNHMTCPFCHTAFCYRCGGRYRRIPFIGDHSNEMSVLGCKYLYQSGNAHQRRLARGGLLTCKIIFFPVLGSLVIVSSACLTALLLTVSPLFGLYVLNTHWQQKRNAKYYQQTRRQITLERELISARIARNRRLYRLMPLIPREPTHR